MMVSGKTTCGFCGCGCGLYLLHEDGNAIGVIPSDKDIVNEGRLCIRGWHIHQPLRNTERILHPLVKGERASYEDAVSFVADVLRRYPPERVGIIGSASATNESSYVVAKFARAVIRTNNVDFPGRSRVTQTLFQLLSSQEGASVLCSFEDLAEADVLFCIGIGESDRYPQVTARIFKAVVEDGRQLLLIDTWQSDFAPYASLYLSPKPFSDEFLLRALSKALDGSIPMPFSSEQVRSITGLSDEQIMAAADLLSSGRRVVAIYDTASLIHIRSPHCMNELLRLLRVLKGMGAEWCRILPMLERCNTAGALRMGVAPDLLPAFKWVTDADAVQKTCSIWGVDKLPRNKGMNFNQMLMAAERKEISALIIIGDDILTDYPDHELLKSALSNLELLVMITAYHSPLTEVAHCVFPRAIWGEVDGTCVNMEGRVCRLVSVCEPKGDARDEWQVLCDVATKLGYTMRYSSCAEIEDELKRLVPEYGDIRLERANAKTCLLRETSITIPTYSAHGEISPPALPSTSEEFPFLLITERYYLPWHADLLALHSSTLQREFRLRFTPHVFVNSAVGSSIGLRDGMPATITTPHGSARVTSIFKEAIPSGIAILPEMFFPQLRHVIGREGVDEQTGAPIYPVVVARLERTR
ncbi:MAG: hypothetical protein HZRFUVUK_000431 [Candidatus Fervidibacterota bacterium]|jgi:predicted molibdopterin-dependent oxidoreductase YjgC